MTTLTRSGHDGLVGFPTESGADAGADGSVLGGAGKPGAAAAAADGGPAAADAAWHSDLPTDLSGNANISKYTSYEDLARGHIAQSALVGKDMSAMVDLPTDAEGRLALNRKMGAPEDITGYTLKGVEGTDPSLAPDGPLAQNFIASAHKHGVHPEAVQGIYTDFVDMLSKNVGADTAADTQARTDGLANLQAEWGEAHQQNVAAARYGTEKLGLMEWVDVAGVGDAPEFIKAMAIVGKAFAEDTVTGADGNTTSAFAGKHSPVEALAKGNSLRSQALTEPNRTRQRELMDQAGAMFKIAYPE